MKCKNIIQRISEPFKQSEKSYPTSKVVLDPTCSLEQILNRAQYGMAIPQRNLNGEITQDELNVLGISGNSLQTMSRMEMIDLRIRAQMRLNALKAKQLKMEQKKREEAFKKGVIDEYEASRQV